ncbi:MAG: precorrin-3B C(17)-methyltransferase [Eubacterium sp.]|nr:precorrin-3B C(17)-methyltransferase [Eubacterium sp.]
MGSERKKILYVVGIGPGKTSGMTGEALAALRESDVIAGYPVYLELLPEEIRGKEQIATGMTREMERCRLALQAAAAGRTVSLVCSGDAGVYGMAGPVLSLAGEYPEVEISVIPGVTAATAGASVLGAPLMHDFAVISMSDRLTPFEVIEKRLRLAAESDFVIVLYNPESRGRAGYLKKACDILLEKLPPDRAAGYVRQIGREGETAWVGHLSELREQAVDMFTTVYIGNSTTYISGARMVTERGYVSHAKQ